MSIAHKQISRLHCKHPRPSRSDVYRAGCRVDTMWQFDEAARIILSDWTQRDMESLLSRRAYIYMRAYERLYGNATMHSDCVSGIEACNDVPAE